MGTLFVVERFEGNMVVIENEDGSHMIRNRELIPKKAREGDILELAEMGLIIREDLTRERRDKIIRKQKKLFKHRSEKT